MDTLNFGSALDLLRDGKRVARAGWNGKGMFLFLIDGYQWRTTNEDAESLELAPFIAMKTADTKAVPWLASQTDILAKDWTQA